MRLSRVPIFLSILGLLSLVVANPVAPETLLKLEVAGRGTITIELYTSQAPKTTAHIIDLVKNQFYDGQKFYRVVKTPRPYLIQFGAPDSRTKSMDDPDLPHEGSGVKIPFEDSGHSNDASGVVGLSTQQGDKDSGDSQFYILLAPAKFLDGNYTVFGKVVEGMDILKAVEKGDQVSTVTITHS
jgi:cyclophilin family peptidyl-prolyl cis-trans isomerase